MPKLTQYLRAVVAETERTAQTAAPYARSGVFTHPIPFFGDPTRARILTVGVNPSAGEFIGRMWPQVLSVDELHERLLGYFNGRHAPPHPWFKTWSEALTSLQLSYITDVAHVDLSPRATVAMGSIVDCRGFAQMVEGDARWFFDLLPICKNVKALLLAGCVTKRFYIDDFIARVAPRYKFSLMGESGSTGEGRVGFLRLTGPNVELPVFFCSISPSARKPQLLVKRVADHRDVICNWVKSQSAPFS